MFAAARRALSTSNAPRVNPKVLDVEGSNLNLMANMAAMVGEELSRAFMMCVRGLFAATARGDQLDRYIMDRTGGQLPRLGASPATVAINIFRATAGAGAGVVPAGTRITSPTGIIFALDADVTFSASDLFQLTTATCTQTGPIGRVPSALLNRFVDQPYDATMLPLSVEGAAGGVDEEDDVKYTARYFGFFPTIRRGILPALQQAALSVAGVEIATAIEILNDTLGYPAAANQLIVGDSDGGSSPTMLTQVRDKLLKYRTAGIPVFVVGGTAVYPSVTWSGLEYLTGIDTVAAQNAVRAVTVAVSQFLAPGEKLRRAALIAGAQAVPGVIVPEGALTVPTGDIVPATPSTLIRIRATNVTIT